jgi:hypothetical protein
VIDKHGHRTERGCYTAIEPANRLYDSPSASDRPSFTKLCSWCGGFATKEACVGAGIKGCALKGASCDGTVDIPILGRDQNEARSDHRGQNT